MDVGKSVVVELEHGFVEGKVVAVAISDEKKTLYKVDSSEWTAGNPQWISADSVFEIFV